MRPICTHSLWLTGVHGCHISCQYLETVMSQWLVSRETLLSRSVFTHERSHFRWQEMGWDKRKTFGLHGALGSPRVQLWYQMDLQTWLNAAIWNQHNTGEPNMWHWTASHSLIPLLIEHSYPFYLPFGHKRVGLTGIEILSFYSPSCGSKSVWCSVFSGAQKQIFWIM